MVMADRGVEKGTAGIRWWKRQTTDSWMKEINRGSNEGMKVVTGNRKE